MNHVPPNPSPAPMDVDGVLGHVMLLCRVDAPYATTAARHTRLSTTLGELETNLTHLYELALEHGHPFLPDLVDVLLRWIDSQFDAGATREMAWPPLR